MGAAAGLEPGPPPVLLPGVLTSELAALIWFVPFIGEDRPAVHIGGLAVRAAGMIILDCVMKYSFQTRN